VARGAVGNRAIVFALERLGITVWAVPTVLLTHHSGHGPAERIVPEDERFDSLLGDLVGDRRAADVDGIITGYFATSAQVHAAAVLVRAVKAANPEVLYVCDPVMGDGAALYVSEQVAQAVRQELLPLADAVTPNAFESAWLTEGDETSDLGALARRLSPPVALITSAPALTRGHIGNLLVTERESLLFEHPLLATPVKGTGDLLAALLLAWRLQTGDWTKAAELAVASVFEIVAGSVKAGADELLLPQLQEAIAKPRGAVDMRRLRTAAAGRTP
jgi:pyridoxine kinase